MRECSSIPLQNLLVLIHKLSKLIILCIYLGKSLCIQTPWKWFPMNFFLKLNKQMKKSARPKLRVLQGGLAKKKRLCA